MKDYDYFFLYCCIRKIDHRNSQKIELIISLFKSLKHMTNVQNQFHLIPIHDVQSEIL